MNKEQIVEMMADAGLKAPARGAFIFIHWDQIDLLLKHQRELCAQVCEQDEFQIYETAERCAAAIRRME